MKQNASDPETLAHCACASRALSDPALEVLWESQHGLERVLGLLPSSFRKLPTGQEDFLGNSHQSFVSFSLAHSFRDHTCSDVLNASLGSLRRNQGPRVGAYATLRPSGTLLPQ